MVKCKLCNKRASFAHRWEKSEYCSEHKLEGMKNVRSKECISEGCDTWPSFAYKGEKAKYCKQHHLVGMEDVVHTKCRFKNCKKQAFYALEREEPTRCKNHKSDVMKNIKGKKCEFESCDTSPCFGLKGEKASRCKAHQIDGMVNVKNKKCELEGCDIQANFGYKGKKAKYCFNHQLDGMEDVNNKQCELCEIRANFGYKGEKARRCKAHQLDKMIDLNNKKCTSCGLFQAIKKNNYLCSYCNPNKSKRQKTKEDLVKTLLETNGYKFTHNKQFRNDCCLKYRPDFIFDCNTYFLVLECDEFAHKDYDQTCEIARMNNISLGLGLPTLFIRYNPDLKGVSKRVKQSELLKTLNKYLHMDFLEDPSPVYLFYSG